MSQNVRETNITNKAIRLLWLWLMRQTEKPVSNAEYARRFGLHSGNASREMRFDFPALAKGLEETFPELASTLRQQTRPSWLDYIPFVRSGKANKSKILVQLVIDHDTGEISWGPFTQKLYCEDKLVDRIEVGGGSSNDSSL